MSPEPAQASGAPCISEEVLLVLRCDKPRNKRRWQWHRQKDTERKCEFEVVVIGVTLLFQGVRHDETLQVNCYRRCKALAARDRNDCFGMVTAHLRLNGYG